MTHKRYVTWFAWYLCSAFALLAMMADVITYHPTSQRLGEVLPILFGCGAILACSIAIVLGRLPSTHWIHNSKPVALVFAALTVAAILSIVAAG